jgi:hypothetical protein
MFYCKYNESFGMLSRILSLCAIISAKNNSLTTFVQSFFAQKDQYVGGISIKKAVDFGMGPAAPPPLCSWLILEWDQLPPPLAL